MQLNLSEVPVQLKKSSLEKASQLDCLYLYKMVAIYQPASVRVRSQRTLVCLQLNTH